jgi:hypothetical protein
VYLSIGKVIFQLVLSKIRSSAMEVQLAIGPLSISAWLVIVISFEHIDEDVDLLPTEGGLIRSLMSISVTWLTGS